MLRLIFIETSLERVPASISDHPAIVRDARKRKKRPLEMILDDSRHYPAMKDLPEREKRGRPDIVHTCLLAALDSELNHKGGLEIFIHTLNNEIIWMSGETRIPRNYNRFLGLMEDLFRKRVIKSDRKLMEVVNTGLEDILIPPVALMKEGGGDFRPKARTVCIGAFPHGDFRQSTLKAMANAELYSVGQRHYTSLYVTYKVICGYEALWMNSTS